MTLSRHILKFLIPLLAAILLQGCGLVYDDEDCPDSCNLIRFTYDYNMKRTCAFDNEVEQLSILLFDAKTGLLAARHDIDHAELNDDNELELHATPGEYEILVWAGTRTKSNESKATEKSFGEDYLIPEGTVGKSNIDDFHCFLKRETDGHVRDIINDLYHARLKVSLPLASPSAPNRININLRKNTNTFRVLLQQTSGEALDHNDFEVAISDQNGWINADNSLRPDETLTYHPWYSFSGSVDINSDPTDAPGNAAKAPEWARTRAGLGASLWELTTSRLEVGNDPRLTIRSKSTGQSILDISPKDYALLVKGFYNQRMDDQEYLDRQDEYNMTFFLNSDQSWLSTVIIINNWRIVRNNVTVE